MAGGNKKKKTKPAANPARGFATTSLPKAKPAATEENKGSTNPPGTATPDTIPVPVASEESKVNSGKAKDQRDLHELSPEELEAQLEADERLQFVEKYAAKVRKEALRQVSRLETDRRVLRGQADYLSVRDWLPEEMMQQIIDLVLDEPEHEQRALASQGSPVGDDLLAKVWTLRSCLYDLQVPPKSVDEVLRWLIGHPPPQDAGSSFWGLSEALDWLAIHCKNGELSEYDYQKPNAMLGELEEPGEDRDIHTPTPSNAGSKKKDSPLASSSEDLTADQNDDDIHVSDIESDVEPDELLATYLRTKARLYEHNPALVDGAMGRKKKTPKSGTKAPQAASKTGGERKLQQKLDRIESDVLFDQREADAQWAVRKVDLARENAERRRLQLSQSDNVRDETSSGQPDTNGVEDEAEKLGLEMLDEDDAGLSGMFDALPGVQQSSDSTSSKGGDVTIRDFGRLTGMSPKRVLEETCKSRDGGAKLHYKLISPTTYTSRQALTIAWTKDQDVTEAPYLPAIEVKCKTRTTILSMIEIATPDVAQSEAYIATVALFLLFSGTPNDKAYMRLPPAFRDLWNELGLQKQEHSNAADSETVKDLRQLIDESTHPPDDDDDDDEVVFKAGSRHRSAAASGRATPVQDSVDRKKHFEPSPELIALWQRKTSAPSYQKMIVGRMNLPMFHYKAAALEAISRNQVTILVSETGSGKSTQLPAFLLEHDLLQGRHCKVYVTEPRRISAISLAQRVSEEMGERKGDVGTVRSLVGYAIRLESHTSPSTRLVYATTGIVLRMLENADGLGDITHLVIDEVHERSIDTDFLLIILRTLLQRRPELKVVCMSATVNARRFSEYLDNAPIIDVPGRTFPVQAKFLEDAIELTGHTNEDAAAGVVDAGDADDNEADAADQKSGGKQLSGYSKRTMSTLAAYNEYQIDHSLILKLLQKVAYDQQYQAFSKAILVFLPGIAEIRQLNDLLAGHPSFRQGWRVFPLHSSFSNEDQQAAFEVPPRGTRKIVLATNIAETGITIPDVTCVIDTGKHKEMRFDEKRQMSRLILSFIARANAKQRRGRAGRVQEGICFHLFTKYRHDELMAENQTPEMLRLSLQDLVMRVKICKLGDIETALTSALDPPSIRNIRRAIDALIEVDALTPKEELTPLGQQLAKLPLDAQLGKLILLGSVFGCLDFALTVAATLTSKTPFLSPMHAKKQADTVRLGFKRGDSDLLTAYNAYVAWRKICETSGMSEFQFCNKNFLSPTNLSNIEDLKAQLLTALVDAGFVQLSPEERSALSRVRPGSRQRNFIALPAKYCTADLDDTVISSVVAWSFYPKIAKQEGKGWRNIANNQNLALHPSSVNKTSLSSDVKLLSFYSIMQSNSRFTNAQETTPAPEVALVLLAGDAVFHMYAGCVVIDGNRLRYKVRDWKTLIVLKTLRSRLRELLARSFKYAGKELTGRHKLWMDVVSAMFERQRKV